MPENKIKHQEYYGGDTTYEARKVITAWELNFNLVSVLKYIARRGKKDPTKIIEDLEKAKTYLEFEIAEAKVKLASEQERSEVVSRFVN